jgi:hypothetical protein
VRIIGSYELTVLVMLKMMALVVMIAFRRLKAVTKKTLECID